jgi:hypothetical protein
MRVQYIADLLDINHQTVVDWLTNNKLAYTREGKMYDIDELDFLHFIDGTKYAYRYERKEPARWAEYKAHVAKDFESLSEEKWNAPPPFAPPESVFRLNEVANLLQTSPANVRRWVDTGKIEATQHGKFLYVSLKEFQRFLREHPKYNVTIGDQREVVFGLLSHDTQLAFLADQQEVHAFELSEEVMLKENETYRQLINENKKKIAKNQTKSRAIKDKYATIKFIGFDIHKEEKE